MCTAKVSLRRPTPEGKTNMVSAFQNRVKTFKDHAAEVGKVSISGLMLSTGCGHACKHCGVSCTSFEKGESLSGGTVLAAQQRGFFKKDSRPILTGGEPLEHPCVGDIYSMLRRDGIYPTIPATNGFTAPQQVQDFESSSYPLYFLGDIDRVSFHILDRWRGNSPGRDNILKKMLLRGLTEVDVIAEFGAEKETIVSWLQTIIRILDSEEILAKKGDRWVSVALRGLPFMGGNSLFGGDVLGPVHHIYMAGRGRTLNGLWVDDTHFIETDMNIPSELGGALLYPNGDLVSFFLACNYWFPSAKARIGTINDDPKVLRANLRTLLVDFFNRSLSKGVEEWDLEIEHHFQNEEGSFTCMLAVFNLVKFDPEIQRLFGEIMRRTDALDFNISGSIHLGLELSSDVFLRALEKRVQSSYVNALTR